MVNDSVPEANKAVYESIGHSITITTTDKDSGDRYSTKRSSKPATQAILNTDKVSNQLNASLALENHTGDTKHMLEVIELPAFHLDKGDFKASDRIQLVLDGSRMSVDGLTCNVPSAEIVYCIIPGDYHPAFYFRVADPNFFGLKSRLSP